MSMENESRLDLLVNPDSTTFWPIARNPHNCLPREPTLRDLKANDYVTAKTTNKPMRLSGLSESKEATDVTYLFANLVQKTLPQKADIPRHKDREKEKKKQKKELGSP